MSLIKLPSFGLRALMLFVVAVALVCVIIVQYRTHRSPSGTFLKNSDSPAQLRSRQAVTILLVVLLNYFAVASLKTNSFWVRICMAPLIAWLVASLVQGLVILIVATKGGTIELHLEEDGHGFGIRLAVSMLSALFMSSLFRGAVNDELGKEERTPVILDGSGRSSDS